MLFMKKSQTGAIVLSGMVAGIIFGGVSKESCRAAVTPVREVAVGEMQSENMLSGWLGVGYLKGEAHEYVFDVNAGGRTNSELTWNIDSLYMFGFGGTVKPQNWLRINGDLWFSIVDGDGYMSDYDWLTAGGDWTHRSLHDDTEVTTGLMFDVNVEMEAFSSQQVAVNGLVGYRLERFEWEARGGSYVYSNNGFRDSIGSFSADTLGVTYEQTFYVPYLGIAIKGDFDRIHLGVKFIGSFLVSGEAIDRHHLRNLETEDDFSGGNMWAIDASIGYDLTDALGVEFTAFYEKYDTMTGDSLWKYKSSGVAIDHPDSAGADLDITMISTRLIYSF